MYICRKPWDKDEQVDWGEADLRVSRLGATAYRPPQARRASTHVVLLKFKGDGGERRAVGGGRREGSRDRGRAANVCSRHTIPYYCSRECQVARFALAARQLVHMWEVKVLSAKWVKNYPSLRESSTVSSIITTHVGVLFIN